MGPGGQRAPQRRAAQLSRTAPSEIDHRARHGRALAFEIRFGRNMTGAIAVAVDVFTGKQVAKKSEDRCHGGVLVVFPPMGMNEVSLYPNGHQDVGWSVISWIYF